MCICHSYTSLLVSQVNEMREMTVSEREGGREEGGRERWREEERDKEERHREGEKGGKTGRTRRKG